MDYAMWASILLATCNLALFWMVRNICCEDWIHSPDKSIGTHHLNTMLSRFDKRLKEFWHAEMKEAIASEESRSFCKAIELGDGYIPDQYCCMRGWFALCLLLNIADRQIDRPCLLVTMKLWQLRLVWCQNNRGYNGAIWKFTLQNSLIF